MPANSRWDLIRALKAVKDKGHGLYLEDSRKAMQVGSITP